MVELAELGDLAMSLVSAPASASTFISHLR